MKAVRAALGTLFLLSSTAPVRADFKYTETLQVTGGALVSMAKFAAASPKDARNRQKQALQPVTITHYVKGNVLRTDRPDGTIEIVDLDGRRIIEIDVQRKTYSVATFDEIKAAMESAARQTQQQSSRDGTTQANPQITVKPEFKITPGAGGRVILNASTIEDKVDMDFEMQATDAGETDAPSGRLVGPNAVAISMSIDTFIAPGVPGYLEFAQLYRRLAQELNWTPPSSIRIDPRMTQGMEEMRKNAEALKGFPLLSYTSMMSAPPAITGDGGQDAGPSNSSSAPGNSSNASSQSGGNGSATASAASVGGFGGLLGKKQKGSSSAQSNQDKSAAGNSNASINSLADVTTQVISFSDSALDSGLFEIPAGYTKVEADPNYILGKTTPPPQAPRRGHR